jgi:hypothetical protein
VLRSKVQITRVETVANTTLTESLLPILMSFFDLPDGLDYSDVFLTES